MTKMKDSGIEWIGEIPSDWNLLKIGSLFKCRNEKVNDTDYPPLSVSRGGIVPQMEGVAKSDANDNRKLVKKNDFVINSRSDRKQSCGVSPLDGSVSLINIVMYLMNRDTLLSEYTYILLKNYGFAEEFYRWGHGIVADLWTTRWQEMKNIALPIPSVEKQTIILLNLNKKKMQIDLLIANQEKQIEKLKAYKQSVITEAVTHGLDPTVPMKDSGVEWIGKIPKEWEIKKIKFVGSIRDERFDNSSLSYIGLENIESYSGKFMKTENEYDISQSNIARHGDVIFGKLRPYLAKVHLIERDAFVSCEFITIVPAYNTYPAYLKWFLLGERYINSVNAATYGTKMPRANETFIKNSYIALPSITEQSIIASFLDYKCSQIDRLIAIKQQKIEKLNDYKKSLIYEYVTGKKEAV